VAVAPQCRGQAASSDDPKAPRQARSGDTPKAGAQAAIALLRGASDGVAP
jgi:hypothetical protein